MQVRIYEENRDYMLHDVSRQVPVIVGDPV